MVENRHYYTMLYARSEDHYLHFRSYKTQNKLACYFVYHEHAMQPSMANLNSPTSKVVKDSTPFQRRILRCINFGNGESSPYQFLDVVNLYLIKFNER